MCRHVFAGPCDAIVDLILVSVLLAASEPQVEFPSIMESKQSRIMREEKSELMRAIMLHHPKREDACARKPLAFHDRGAGLPELLNPALIKLW